MYEVELKFPVRDPKDAWQRLSALGAATAATVEEVDWYFAHPSRHFASTDEALRIRSVASGNTLTYKGPVIDAHAKMRREIEVPFEAGEPARERMTHLLAALGFQPVRRVLKWRRWGTLHWQGTALRWTWDEVPPLGEFVELELVVEEGQQEAARDLLCGLAELLAFGPPEKRSYLELLLAADRREADVSPEEEQPVGARPQHKEQEP
jgi:adenylate cyclase class 2